MTSETSLPTTGVVDPVRPRERRSRWIRRIAWTLFGLTILGWIVAVSIEGKNDLEVPCLLAAAILGFFGGIASSLALVGSSMRAKIGFVILALASLALSGYALFAALISATWPRC